jgi:hypothetical protein
MKTSLLNPVSKSSFLFAFLFCLHTFAQDGSTIVDLNILAKQKEVMAQYYPDLFTLEEITGVDSLDELHSKVKYTRDGKNFEAVVNSGPNDLLLVATCEEIRVNKLPSLLKEVFAKSEVGSKIEKAFLVTTPYSSDFYRIDYYRAGYKKILTSVFYDEMGHYQKPPY